MEESCPISLVRVDQNVARVTGGFVVLVAVSAVFLGSGWTLAALALDFVFRGSPLVAGSPLRALACAAVRVAGARPLMVDAAPKRFAARIGAGMSAVAAVLMLSGSTAAGASVAGVLVFCALLESALGFCLGCKMYTLLPRKVATILAR